MAFPRPRTSRPPAAGLAGQHLGEEVPVGVGAGEVRVEEIGQEPGPGRGIGAVMRQGVVDPVEQLDLVRVLPGGLDEHVGVRGGRMAGVRVVGGDQDQRPLGPDHLEGELDQVVVDAAVAIGVDQDQLGKLVPVAEVACHPDALLETAAALGVDVEPDPRQIGDREQHGGVADCDRWGAVAAAVGIALGLGGVDVAAAELRLADRQRSARLPEPEPEHEQTQQSRLDPHVVAPGPRSSACRSS